MKQSESITKLSVALAKFNGEVSAIAKDAKNPFFKSDYVTLDKLILSTREILQKNGLSVLQFPSTEDNKIGVKTMLLHESGEFIESDLLYMIPSKANDPQQAGSLITYLRRYSYQAILNLATGEDDDGNKATYGQNAPTRSSSSKGNNTPTRSKTLSEDQIKALYEVSEKAGYSAARLVALVKAKYKCEPVYLTKAEYEHVYGSLNKK